MKQPYEETEDIQYNTKDGLQTAYLQNLIAEFLGFYCSFSDLIAEFLGFDCSFSDLIAEFLLGFDCRDGDKQYKKS